MGTFRLFSRKDKNPKRRGQAMTEFVIALPILLFIIFGIIEMARLAFAWMALQNAARFGIRYAVTGDYDPDYCDEAAAFLNSQGEASDRDYALADTDGGDPQDCDVPESYTYTGAISGVDANSMERELIDYARLHSIQDAVQAGGTGLWLEPSVSGDYEQYLSLHSLTQVGQPEEDGFLKISTCSNRETTSFNPGADVRFAYGPGLYSIGGHDIDLCEKYDETAGTWILMDDPGGPGNRVKVHLEHRHPLFLPLLTNIVPAVTLEAERNGIVENFRASRILGAGGFVTVPTWTQTPTITNTPTETFTPTFTLTSSVTNTPTNTPTPIPFDCDLVTIVNSGTDMWFNWPRMWVQVRNDNPVGVDAHFFQAEQIWDGAPARRAEWFRLEPFIGWDNEAAVSSPHTWNPLDITMSSGDTATYYALFHPQGTPLDGLTSVDLVFDNGCVKGVTADLPTATPTPIPNCNLYTMGNWSFHNESQQSITITNGDAYDAELERIIFHWDFAEDFGAANGAPNMYTNWFRWGGGAAWSQEAWNWIGWGADNSSPTDTSVDSPWLWYGPLAFDAGNAYSLRVDLDNDWGGGGPLPDVISDDFGLRLEFDNGCVLERGAVPRVIYTYTPTNTFTPTETGTNTPTPTGTWTATLVPTSTNTLIPSATFTPSITPTPSDTPTVTNTAPPTPTYTKTNTPSVTPFPTNTPLPTNTPIPSNTPMPSPTFTSTPVTPTVTNTPIPSPTPTPTFGGVID